MAFNMWLPLTLLVLAGLVSANFEHGWKVGNEYTYLVRSRTLTSLDKLSDQYTGILLKALLTVQVKDQNTLGAKVWKGQYARIHKELPHGWDSEISDQMLELRDLPISEKPFEIKITHGVIKDLIVDKEVPTWEVNLLKAIVSQLQVDTQGENVIKSNSIQVPTDDEPYGTFKAMEDTVGGNCEVLYDITPLPVYMVHTKPELVPLPHLKGDGQHIDIMKTKNFSRCDQRMDYHFGISGQNTWEPGTNDNGQFLSKSSMSRIIISGNLKQFTIQSSVTTSQMFVSPRFYDFQNGIVASRMNLTLRSLERISNSLPSPNNPESTGKLVYIYNNPFSDFEERRLSPNQDSNQNRASDGVSSVSSSEEMIKNGQNPRLHGSSTSSASSSSISSSEEHQFWQPKPTLEEAPQNPLLPNFIGYKGKFIGKSGEIDLVRATKELVFQIANELEDPTNIPTQQTLEKFTILSGLIRLMSRRQLAEAESNMHISPNELKSNDKSQAIKQNAWTVFRDAITQAGTGPALLTIKNWIEQRKVVGWEAADIVSRIPKNARTPTAQYIRAVFDMATNPNVMEERFLNSTAILAFTELVRLAQVNRATLHNRYPVHSFGRLVSKHDTAVVEEYIPYLAQELQNAIKDGNSPRIQTLIMALGNIGHPRILSVLEPYLEGKLPVTVFQRTMMVASLNKLSEMYPKLARSVLYKIYLNTMEVHEVRCTAVFLLIKTNPPLSMLQRMAEFTNYDTNKHVNSAVKSIIENLASMTSPVSQELTNKARAASNLLNPSDYTYQFSHGYIFDGINEKQNLIYRTLFNYIGSDDSLLPKALYLGWFASYGDFKIPPTEWAAMVSSVRPLINMLDELQKTKSGHSGKTRTEQIAEELNIIPEEPIQLEGNVLLNSKFISRFLPFDKHTLNNIPSVIVANAMAMKNMRYFNMNKLMSYDVVLSFPTETGLPFVYSFRIPILCKLSGKSEPQINVDMTMSLKSDIRAVYSKKIQGRIGFVTPFEHQHYIAGVDMNFQTYAPLRLALDVNRVKKNVQLKVWPLKGEEKARLFHYSVVPYTSTHDILNLRPLLTEKSTHKIQTQEIRTKTIPLPLKEVSALKLNLEAEKSNEEFWNSDANIMSPLLLENDKYRQADLYSNLEQEQKEPVILNVAYDSMNAESGSVNPQEWTSTVQAVIPSEKEVNSHGRRKQLLQEALKGISLAESQVVDIQLQTPGELQSQNALTVAWSSSNVEDKARILLYWNLNIPQENVKYEVCAASQAWSTLNPLLSYDETIKSKPKMEFDVDLRYGETCSKNQQINIKGKAIQTNEMKDKIKNSRLVKACLEEMKQGNKILQTCQNAAILARILDEIDISMDVQSKTLQELMNQVVQMIGNTDYINAQVETSKPKNAGKNKIEIKAKLLKDLDTAHVSLHTPTMDVLLNNLDLSDLDLTADDILGVNDEIVDNQVEQSCVLDKTRAQTFDGKSYPLRLGNCWHVVMTTYPKLNPENRNEKLRIPENNRVTILSKEVQNGQKEVKVILGDIEIKLVPTNSQPEAKVNERTSSADDIRLGKLNEVQFQLYRLEDNSIVLVSDKYDVNLVYDGKRVLIKASELYRNSVRGLCGNFDGNVVNDFLVPQNCVMRKPEHFIASYALTKDQCEGEALQNAKRVSKNDCWRPMRRWSNVISDIDAGRLNNENHKWGYHQGEKLGDKRSAIHRTQIIEEDNKICFTMRPVITCAPGYTPTEVKTKNYQFHCMERNDASLNMKRRVEKGANPDLSQKPVSMSRPIDVPLACQA